MDFLDIVKERRSVRKFLNRDVESEKLEYVMDCARRAPSAANRQPWKFYILKSTEYRDKILEAYTSKWFSTDPAPLVIVACADTNASWRRSYDGKDYSDVDIAIAFEHICLSAASVGLGTCWIAHFDPSIVQEVLELEEGVIPVAMTPLGYPDPDYSKDTPRKKLDEIMVIL